MASGRDTEGGRDRVGRELERDGWIHVFCVCECAYVCIQYVCALELADYPLYWYIIRVVLNDANVHINVTLIINKYAFAA